MEAERLRHLVGLNKQFEQYIEVGRAATLSHTHEAQHHNACRWHMTGAAET